MGGRGVLVGGGGGAVETRGGCVGGGGRARGLGCAASG